MIYDYYKSDDFLLRIQEDKGLYYMHLDVQVWTRRVLKELRLVLDLLFIEYKHKGCKALFALTDNDKTVKFWQLVRPTHQLIPVGPKDKYTLGMWEIVDFNGT